MSDIFLFIGMWIGISLIQFIIYKCDKSNTIHKNINV